jgi:hypothetical protein
MPAKWVMKFVTAVINFELKQANENRETGNLSTK